MDAASTPSNHDSYQVTVVEPGTGRPPRRIEAAPPGRGAFDKPHYAAQTPDGRLLLPFQGRTLLELEPASGRTLTRPLAARTHQHGVALTPGGRTLVVVGTGPAGGVNGPPSLTLLDLASGAERGLPLTRPHELVALSPDGRWAYLTGGYLLDGGWSGITIVDLTTGTTTEVPVPGSPLGIAVLPR